jgi:uncharacterized protein GlcG (DUF336 family)
MSVKMNLPKMISERAIRDYASHLALVVRRHGKLLSLYERYDDQGYHRRKMGTYRSWAAVKRAIKRYHKAELERLMTSKASRRSK